MDQYGLVGVDVRGVDQTLPAVSPATGNGGMTWSSVAGLGASWRDGAATNPA
jgi:hypothetical protein